MILAKLQLINYKSCKNLLIELEKDNPNILIGINDSGKSTILTAIGLLLDDKWIFRVKWPTYSAANWSTKMDLKIEDF